MVSRSQSQFITFCVIASFVAAALRGSTLLSRGILEHDEGHALLNANTWHQVMRWVLGGGLWSDDGASITQLRDALHQQGGTLYSAGKFGYSLLLATVALPGQVTTSLGLLMALFAGVAVCLLAGLLTWKYTQNAVAAALTLFGCAMSPLLISLSREVSGTIWALVFGLAAACALQAGADATSKRRRWLWGIFGGLLLGYGFTCHFNLAPFIVAVFLATGVYASLNSVGVGRIFAFAKSVTPAAIGSLFVLGVFEAVTRVVDYRLRDAFPEFRSFFGELQWLLFRDQPAKFDGEVYGDGAIGWGWNAWAVYANAAWREGLVWIGLLLVAIYFVISRQRHKRSGTVRSAILLLFPLLFWAAYIYRVERVLGMCVAASFIFIGVVFSPALTKKADTRPWVGPLIFSLLFLHGLIVQTYLNDETPEVKSPIPEVTSQTIQHIQKNGGQITAGSFDTGFAPLWKWTIVEQMREKKFRNIRSAVDFSRYDGADILFIDPATWRRPGGSEFTITKEQAMQGRRIVQRDSIAPLWRVQSRDLRLHVQ